MCRSNKVYGSLVFTLYNQNSVCRWMCVCVCVYVCVCVLLQLPIVYEFNTKGQILQSTFFKNEAKSRLNDGLKKCLIQLVYLIDVPNIFQKEASLILRFMIFIIFMILRSIDNDIDLSFIHSWSDTHHRKNIRKTNMCKHLLY